LDRIFPYYSAFLIVAYAGVFLSGTGDVRVGGVRIARTAAGAAAIHCLGDLVILTAIGVLAVVAATAVDGGPVALAPEDLRVLLPAPVSRGALLGRALRAAYARAFGAAILLCGLLFLLDIALLSQPARYCALPDLAFPLCLGVIAVSMGWLIETSQRSRLLGRGASILASSVLLVVAGVVARRLGTGGQLDAWARLHRIGDLPVLRPVVDAAEPGPITSASVVVVAALIVVALGLAAWAWKRIGAVSAEQISQRSGRALAVRRALLLGLTSSAYLTRTAHARLRRRKRWAPTRARTPGAALLVKAFVQEQGAPLLARAVLAAVTVVVIDSALLARYPGTTVRPGLLLGAGAGIVMSAVATRFTDPLRIDTGLSTPAGSLPLRFSDIAGADLTASAVTFSAGGAAAAVVVPALSLQPWSSFPVLLGIGVLLGPIASAIGAISAVSNNPSALLSPGIALAVRLQGLIASIVVMSALAILARPPDHHHLATGTHTYTIVGLLPLVAALVFWARAAGGKALQASR
jgi:hypothetical protein